MENSINPSDGKHVVIQNGQRITGPLTQQEAKEEAQRRNQLEENQGKPVPESKRAQVKQNIFG